MSKLRALAICLAALVTLSPGVAVRDDSADAVTSANQLVDRYFDLYFRFHPTAGTSDGFHQYDVNLEDYSRANLDREAAALKSILPQFQSALAQKPPRDLSNDLEFVQSQIHARLLELETIRMWQK